MSGAPKEKFVSRDYVMITLFCGVFMIFIQMFFPIMSIYAKKISGNDFVTGIIPGVFTCSSFIAVRLSVPVIRKYGKAMTMAIGCAVMALASVIYYFSSHIWVLILARIVHGLGSGLCIPANTAAIADVVPKSRLMEGIGYYSLVQTIAGALAPAFVLNLVQENPSGFQIVFILAFFLALLCFLLSFTITYEKKGLYGAHIGREEAGKEKKTAALPSDLKLFMGIETILLLPMLLMFLSNFVTQGLGSYLPLSTQERGIPSIAYFFTIQAVAVFASRLIVSRVADKYSVGIIVVPSLLILAACMYFVDIATNARMLNIIAVPYGLASGALFPTMNGHFFKIGATGRNAETSADFSAMGNLSAVFMSITAAILSSMEGGYKSLYHGMFLLPLAAFAAYLFHAAQLRRRTERRLSRQAGQ